jgi:hypothetical protein
MTPLEEQITVLLGMTGTSNVLEAINYVERLKLILELTERQKQEWADLCFKKQLIIDKLKIKYNDRPR